MRFATPNEVLTTLAKSLEKIHSDPKTVFIIHPIGGDVEGNVAKIKALCKRIHQEELDTVAIAPYLHLLEVLDDNDPVERATGLLMSCHFLTELCDEAWCFGESDGCAIECAIAKRFNIPLIDMSNSVYAKAS